MGITRHTAGFTIIETMLFLAVSAALSVAVLVGTSTAINQQRYQDAVNTLQSFLQDQYSQVISVSNDRTGQEGCNSSAQVTQGGNGDQARGTSNCLILGRLITIDPSGQQLNVKTVVGTPQAGADTAASDLAALNLYTLGTADIAIDSHTADWGTTLTNPKGAPEPASIMIVRSPLSGRLLTFTAPSSTVSPADLLKANTTNPFLLCVDPHSLGVNTHLGVQIDPTAAGSSAVEIPLGSSGVCG